MIPLSPGKHADGTPIDYSAGTMDRFWAAAADAGLPIGFHIGEVPGSGGRGGFGTFFLVQAAPFRRVLGNLIFGGILDRHPTLRIVFAEGGINWVPGALQDAELTFGAHREIFDLVPKHRPTDYWHENLYATFQTDAIGLDLLDRIGADRVMWAQDYPHGEGTFGYTAAALRQVIEATSEANARLILGDTATKSLPAGVMRMRRGGDRAESVDRPFEVTTKLVRYAWFAAGLDQRRSTRETLRTGGTHRCLQPRRRLMSAPVSQPTRDMRPVAPPR